MDSPYKNFEIDKLDEDEKVDRDPGERLMWFGKYRDTLKFGELPESYIQEIMNQYVPEYDQGHAIPHKHRYLPEFIRLYHERNEWLERRGKGRSPGKIKIWFGSVYVGQEIEDHLQWAKAHTWFFKTRVLQIEGELKEWEEKQSKGTARDRPTLSNLRDGSSRIPELPTAPEEGFDCIKSPAEVQTTQPPSLSPAESLTVGVVIGMLISCWCAGSNSLHPKAEDRRAHALLMTGDEDGGGDTEHLSHHSRLNAGSVEDEFDETETEDEDLENFITNDSNDDTDDSGAYTPSTIRHSSSVMESCSGDTNKSESSSITSVRKAVGASTNVSSTEEELDWDRLDKHPRRNACTNILQSSGSTVISDPYRLPTPIPDYAQYGNAHAMPRQRAQRSKSTSKRGRTGSSEDEGTISQKRSKPSC